MRYQSRLSGLAALISRYCAMEGVASAAARLRSVSASTVAGGPTPTEREVEEVEASCRGATGGRASPSGCAWDWVPGACCCSFVPPGMRGADSDCRAVCRPRTIAPLSRRSSKYPGHVFHIDPLQCNPICAARDWMTPRGAKACVPVRAGSRSRHVFLGGIVCPTDAISFNNAGIVYQRACSFRGGRSPIAFAAFRRACA